VPKKYRWRNSKNCYWCGRSVHYKLQRYPDGNQATRDHLIPKSLATRSIHLGVEFQVVSCRRCNIDRGNSMDWVPFHLKEEGSDGEY
jgi:NMD protein affecting ribosome stability and mRNA decay